MDLYNRLQGTESLGSHGKLWFGSKPGGGIFFHIYGHRYAPFQLWRNAAGELRVFGNWRQWSKIRNDARFEQLALLLGQDYTGGAKSIAISGLDLEQFWNVAAECDRAINE
jgi:hypothetical protein